LRAEVANVRRDQAELRSDVEHIAEQLDLPRPRSATRRAKPSARARVADAAEVANGD
jgi:hypothetical protein